MKENQEILQELLKFRNERDWEQFHNPKDLALAISIESAELLELFLWKNANEANTEKIKEELADIFSFAFLLADKYGFTWVVNSDKLNENIVFLIDQIKTSVEFHPLLSWVRKSELDDNLLNRQAFCGYENTKNRKNLIANGVIGCIPHHPLLKQIIEYYKTNIT